jgi:hypothetical protein
VPKHLASASLGRDGNFFNPRVTSVVYSLRVNKWLSPHLVVDGAASFIVHDPSCFVLETKDLLGGTLDLVRIQIAQVR